MNTLKCVQLLELQLLKRARQKNISISTQSTSENFCMFTVLNFATELRIAKNTLYSAL